ncbi:RNA polymerase sigma factor [Capnocytophaga stomatis]|uniref:RNA polymerase sigma factor n=1 Tax=Capnocytophaga stomatis TaxID=1848904 RepID=A0ABW8QBH9_9FLAO|nr:sigma-70 family RNA polymerase sigma factor [Capnocytophaga stomatis]GIJ94386.1 DNA-directed RNA polymerase sigma-70 factor [Capnocytophaga stomatis]
MKSLEKEFLERIEKHRGILFKIAKMYMDDIDDQRDLFQEITYQLWKAYPSFQGKSEFSTWMYRVALNTAIVFLKSEKKKDFISRDDNLHSIKIKDEDSSEEEHQIKIMYDAIHLLNPIDKALIFYYLENYSGKEIAEQMGLSEVNVRVKLSRAKSKLSEIVKKLNV